MSLYLSKSCYKHYQWRIQGGIPGSHGSPLSAQLSSRSVCTMKNFSLDGSPHLMNSKIILTIAHLLVDREWVWSSRKWAWHQTFARALRAFFILGTPLPKFLDPPLTINTEVIMCMSITSHRQVISVAMIVQFYITTGDNGRFESCSSYNPATVTLIACALYVQYWNTEQ